LGIAGGNGRAVNAIQRLEQIAGNGHQGARVAGRHRGGSRAILDLLMATRMDESFLRRRATSTGSSMATTSEAGTMVARSCANDCKALGSPPTAGAHREWVQELAARRERDAGAVVAPHAVNSQCDHGRLVQAGLGPKINATVKTKARATKCSCGP
jgi:hypothetical protein